LERDVLLEWDGGIAMRRVTMAAMTLGCGLAWAQSAPVKMGLWEGTRLTTPVGGAPTTLKSQICVTPESFEKSLGMINAQTPGCKIDTVKNAKGYTFVGSCALPNGGSMQLRGAESIDDPEHTSGSSHTTMTMGGKTIESDSKRTSRFVRADCGAVAPGKPVILR
jgi:hypothetical protein